MATIDITNIMLVSVDGRIATNFRENTGARLKSGISCDLDQVRLRQLLQNSDAVFIGWRSLRVERGAIRASDPSAISPKEPLWIVFSDSGDLDINHPFFKQPGISKAIFHCTSFNMQESPALKLEHVQLGTESVMTIIGNIVGLFAWLEKTKKNTAALLGGGKLNSLFWQKNLVRKLSLTISPVIIGQAESISFVSDLSSTKKLKLTQTSIEGDFIFVDYVVINENGSD